MVWDPNPPDGLKYVQRHYGKDVELESKDPSDMLWSILIFEATGKTQKARYVRSLVIKSCDLNDHENV